MSLFVSIKKDFGSFALDVSFESNGEILGFLGASGCGKSMTLKCIAGIETPDEGIIILDGETLFDRTNHINLRPQERRVGYLFQNYGLFPNMTVEQNIMCGVCQEKSRKKKRQEVRTVIKRMMLEGLEKRYPSQISGGQQQRVALARILVNRPRLLLLDEPFSALDSYLKVQVETEMKKILKEFGKDTILVSHSRDEIYRLCDNLAIIDDGQLLGMGSAREMFRNPMSRRGAALTGCKNIVNAVKTGEYEVSVPSWGMRFTTSAPVGDSLCAIGIRAHYFHEKITDNQGEVEIVEQVEEPFEWIINFRYRTADTCSEPVWWRVSKEVKMQKMSGMLGVEPKNIMLLYR